MKKVIYLLCFLSLQEISLAMDTDGQLTVSLQELDSYGVAHPNELNISLQELNSDNAPDPFQFYPPVDPFNDPGFFPQDPLLPDSLPILNPDQLELDLSDSSFTIGLPMKDLTRQDATNNDCPICNKKFLSPSKLALHMRTHTGEKPYQCEICGRKFSEHSNLKSHKKRVHSESTDSSRSLKCSSCNTFFKRLRDLTKHEKMHVQQQQSSVYNVPTDTVSLNQNFLPFLNLDHVTPAANLQSHAAPFQDATNTVCKICGQQCNYPSILAVHMTKHSDEKPYQCEICGKAFKVRSKLKFHKKNCEEKHRNPNNQEETETL